jgi:exodeoxyribonuclease VII small subunit
MDHSPQKLPEGQMVRRMKMAKQKPVADLSFEEASSELEAIVATLENEQKSLEDSMALFERGQALIKHCSALLDKAELRVKQLTGSDLLDFKDE